MKSRFSYMLLVTVVTLLGLSTGYGINKLIGGSLGFEGESEGTMTEASPPASLGELAGSSDVIVIGTFHAIEDEGVFYGYGEHAKENAESDNDSPTPLSVPFTDFEFAVEKVLLDDGRRLAGEPLIIRFVANSNDRGMPQIGDRRLLFLRVTPDEKAYGLASFVSSMDITGRTVVFRQGNQVMVPFGKKLRPDELIEEVERELKRPSYRRER